jgi:peptidoglycan/LPS O-acetylase OafA/YrhL
MIGDGGSGISPQSRRGSVRFTKAGSYVAALALVAVFASAALAQNPEPGPDAGFLGLGAFGAVVGCICAVALVAFLINIFILVWVYKDAQARGADPTMWLLIVFFTHLVGLIIWLIVRPPLRESR